jgi:hypothetical protein
LACLTIALCSGCAHKPSWKAASATKDAGRDASAPITDADNPASIVASDAGANAIKDAEPADAADAFFINDPAPPMCGENGAMLDAQVIEGTADCPDDKNREGCACDKPGDQASCWPGKRVNRDHGICKDGMTKCISSGEFGAHWGPCQGYVLPIDGALQGAAACRCFSKGEWALNNLVPCVYQDDKSSDVEVYSSSPSATGYECMPVTAMPEPAPAATWNSSTLTVDCAGQYKLCYTMKAGLIATPKASDCVLMQECVDIWYAEPGKAVPLPDLPGWSASDLACSQRFVQLGGYGEMSVIGKSSECDAVDDGKGQPYVFKRTSYCPPSCAATPGRAECVGCSTGGSGQF